MWVPAPAQPLPPLDTGLLLRLQCSHRGGRWWLPRICPSGSYGPHLRSQSEPHAPAAAGGLRPRRWMAEDGASAAGGLPGDTGQGWRTSLWRPLPGTQPAGTCDRLQKPPHLRGGEPQERSAGLTCSPGNSGHLSSVLSASWLPSPSQALQGLSPLTSESVWKVPCLDLTQGSPKCGLGCGVGC